MSLRGQKPEAISLLDCGLLRRKEQERSSQHLHQCTSAGVTFMFVLREYSTDVQYVKTVMDCLFDLLMVCGI